MGEATYILRVKISRDHPKKLLYLSHENYIRKVLERFNMQNSSSVDTPISKGHALGVGLVSRPQTDCDLAHWQAVKRIMRYLKEIADYDLCYQGGKVLRLVGYINVDHGGDLDERKSTSGYVFLVSDSAISWSSKK
ncbi:secreted RxLR effector protein 161-like [Nicotiana tabacum]|uniref:Secreted RxLR effector protein 161-like n=1 Tax=Nicotiana tabacum TaxID=4097 RepID=A0AC58TQ98_TOBAC